jgi:hypothetical protein
MAGALPTVALPANERCGHCLLVYALSRLQQACAAGSALQCHSLPTCRLHVIHIVCRIVYKGGEEVNADGSSKAGVRAWSLKRKLDGLSKPQRSALQANDADAPAAQSSSGDDGAEEEALADALDAFAAGEISDDDTCSHSGSESLGAISTERAPGAGALQAPLAVAVQPGSSAGRGKSGASRTVAAAGAEPARAAPPSFSKVCCTTALAQFAPVRHGAAHKSSQNRHSLAESRPTMCK